jgi:hypothetical protein
LTLRGRRSLLVEQLRDGHPDGGGDCLGRASGVAVDDDALAVIALADRQRRAAVVVGRTLRHP